MPRALIVDDTRTMRAVLRSWLSRAAQWEVREAGSGAEALAEALAARPDVAVLDWYLPDTDGGALAQKLRALPGLAKLPVLFLSTGVAEDECREAAAKGRGAYLLKPLTPDAFLAALDSLHKPA